MTNNHVEDQLPAYLLGDLSDSESQQVKQHLSTCQSCSARAEKLSQSMKRLQNTPPQVPADADWDMITRRAYAEVSHKSRPSTITSFISILLQKPPILAVSLAVLFSFFFFLFFLLNPSAPYPSAAALTPDYLSSEDRSFESPEDMERFLLGFQAGSKPITNAYAVGHLLANTIIHCHYSSDFCNRSFDLLDKKLDVFLSTYQIDVAIPEASTTMTRNIRLLKELDQKLFLHFDKKAQLLYSLGAWSRYLGFAVENRSIKHDKNAELLQKYLAGIESVNLPVGASKSLKKIDDLLRQNSTDDTEYMRLINSLNTVFL